MAGDAGDPTAARRLLEESIALYEQAGRHACRGPRAARGSRSRRLHGSSRRGHGPDGACLRRRLADEPDEDLALLAARPAARLLVRPAISSGAAERAELALDIAEAQGFPEPLAIALRAKASGRRRAADTTRRPWRSSSTRSRSRSSTTSYAGDASSLLHALRSVASVGPRTPTLSIPRRGARPRAEGRGPPARMGEYWRSEPIPSSCSAVGTRRSRRARNSPRSSSTSGGLLLSLLQSAARGPSPARRADGARRCSRCSPDSRSPRDVQSAHVLPRLDARAMRRAEGQLREALVDAEAAIEAGRTLGVAAAGRRSKPSSKGSRRRSIWAIRTRSRSCSSIVESVPPGAPAPRTSMRRRSAFGHAWTVIRPATKPRPRASASSASPSGLPSRCSSTAS